MTICHGIPWYRNGADDHCPFIIEGWWLFFYPLSYLTLTLYLTLLDNLPNAFVTYMLKFEQFPKMTIASTMAGIVTLCIIVVVFIVLVRANRKETKEFE